MKRILVTNTLFILPEHEQALLAAGFAMERLAAAEASQEELIKAIKDKAGYILGGAERVTRRVIDAANALETIVFCGTDYRYFIPAWRYAVKKGIAVMNVPDAFTHAVAEWAQAAALFMNRGFCALAQPSITTAVTSAGLEGQVVGIVGLGRIGSHLAEMLQANRVKTILYYSTHRHRDLEKSLRLQFLPLSDLLSKSDVVFLCVSGDVGKDFLGPEQLSCMKPNALLVSFMVPGVINADALLAVLASGKIRAISDYPADERFTDLPLSRWCSFGVSGAFNTFEGIRRTSEEAVRLLVSKLDQA